VLDLVETTLFRIMPADYELDKAEQTSRAQNTGEECQCYIHVPPKDLFVTLVSTHRH
jgi:hypothetical protein